MKRTPLWKTRKAMAEIFLNNNYGSEELLVHMSEVFPIILDELDSEPGFINARTNLRLFFIEMLFSFKNHQFNSVAVLFRALTVAFCVEYFDLSITKQKEMLSNFQNAIDMVCEIFGIEEHDKAGYEQLSSDFEYEISLLDPVNDVNSIVYLNHQRERMLGNFNYDKYVEDTRNNFKKTIRLCNKIAHSELILNENDDLAAIKLRDNAIMCVNLAISMLVLLIRKYNNNNS